MIPTATSELTAEASPYTGGDLFETVVRTLSGHY